MVGSVVLQTAMLTAATLISQVQLPPDAPARSFRDRQELSTAERAQKTVLQFELLSDGPLGGGVRSRDWAKLLQEMGAEVRIRQSQGDDELGVTEKTRGTLRWVKVTAVLNSNGQITLPDQQYSLSNTERLREWFDELKLYGAQGSPEGKPLWGLSKNQFEIIFHAMSTPIPQDSYGETLTTALQQMSLPEEYPVRYHSTASDHLAQFATEMTVRQRVAGVTAGTGLAAVLADYGLGFRPLRTPTGDIELVVQPLSEIPNPWPVGWEVKKETSRLELAPQLFKMHQVKFNDIPIQAVFDDITQTTGLPIIVDYYAAEAKGIDLNETTLSYPLKRAAWMQVIHSAAVRNRLTENLRIDERGQPFVHVAPFVPRRQSVD